MTEGTCLWRATDHIVLDPNGHQCPAIGLDLEMVIDVLRLCSIWVYSYCLQSLDELCQGCYKVLKVVSKSLIIVCIGINIDRREISRSSSTVKIQF